MIDILVKVIIVVAALIVFGATYAEELQKIRKKERDDDAFEYHRALRQQKFDQHARAVARAMLMQEYAKVHFVGEAWHD